MKPYTRKTTSQRKQQHKYNNNINISQPKREHTIIFVLIRQFHHGNPKPKKKTKTRTQHTKIIVMNST